MRTRYLKGAWAQQYREAASRIGIDRDYYGELTGTIISHIRSCDFTIHNDKRHPQKIAGLLLKAARGRPERHIRIKEADIDREKAYKKAWHEEGNAQITTMFAAFINAVSTGVLSRQQVIGCLEAACNELPKPQRDTICGFIADKFGN